VRKSGDLGSSCLLTGLIITIVGPIVTTLRAFAYTDKLVGFAANVEMIKGHMSQTLKNIQRRNYELAKAHA
jgi:hypothetical protein